MHGGFTNQVMYPHRKKSGLFHIANYIKQIRLAQKNVILLDTGDIISGSPLSIYYNYLYPTRLAENPFFRLLNSLKYDAIVPGNHDLEHLSLLENFYIPGGKTKWIAANIQQSGIPFFSPYLSIHQPNFKIVIIGATTPGILIWSNISTLATTRITSVKQALIKWIAKIKKEIEPDFLILAIHGGLNPMRDDENGKLNRIPPVNDIRSLLPDFPEIDFIISGHDHQLYPYRSNQKLRYIDQRPVVSAGKHAETVTNIKLSLQKKGNTWKIINHQVNIFKAADSNQNKPPMTSFSQDYLTFINEPFNWKVHKASTTIAASCINELLALSFSDQKTAGSLFPSIEKISLYKVKNQILRRKHIYQWLRYPNHAVSIKMSHNDIFLATHPKPEFGKRRSAYNRRLFSYFKTEWNNTLNKQSWWPNRKDYKKNKTVKISDYHFYGGGGVLSAIFLKQKGEANITGKIFQEQLIDYLKSNQQLEPESCQFLKYQSVTSAVSPK